MPLSKVILLTTGTVVYIQYAVKLRFFTPIIAEINNLFMFSLSTGFSLSRRRHLRCLLLESFRFPSYLSPGYLHTCSKRQTCSLLCRIIDCMSRLCY